MRLKHSYALLCIPLLLVFTACRDLRGYSRPSPDGKTYLVIDDDNGGGCGAIKVDGQVWPHKTNERGLIEPGVHKISCGEDEAWVEAEVPEAREFHFDYWGP